MFSALFSMSLATVGPTITLNNGVVMPQLALGVWQYDNATAEGAIALAFEAGFRQIDTAEMYGNQVGVGSAVAKLIAGGMKRSDIFVTTKTLPYIEGDLSALNLDYVDLILLHAPSTGVHTGACNAAACAINKAQWQAYESIYKQGKAKAIGVSNYCQSCLECLMGGNTTVPAVNQFQLHVGMGPDPTGLVSYGKTKGIHGKSGAQVALKWLIQKGLSVSTKANSSAYLQEDIDVFDWTLTADEVQELDSDNDYPGSPCWACSE
eukprot:gene11727-9852_t